MQDDDEEEWHNLHLTHAVKYQRHTTTARGRFIQNTRPQGNMVVDIGKM